MGKPGDTAGGSGKKKPEGRAVSNRKLRSEAKKKVARSIGEADTMGDISERKKAEERMRESEAKYRLLADNVSDVIWTADMDLNTTYISPSIYSIQGHTPEEAMNLTQEQRYTPESLEMVSKLFMEAVANEAAGIKQPDDIGTYQAEYIRKDGSTYWTETKASVIRDADGKAVGILGVTRDIDQSRKAQMALCESEERFRRISQITTDIAYSCLTDQEGALHIDWISGAIEHTTGYTADEIMAQSCWRFLVVEEDIPLFEKNVVGLSPGQSAFCDLRICHKHGQFIWVRSFAECISEINTSNEPRLYGGLRNITDSKRTEDTLRESEEMFRVAQEISPDGFTILHPLRNEKGDIIDFTWVYENKTIARINGTDPAEVKGKRMLDLFPTHKGTSIFEAYIHVSNSGKPQIIEEVYVGEIVSRPTWLRLVVVSIGEDIAILAQDITERKQSEESLRISEAQYRLLADHTQDLVWLMDMNLKSLYLSPSTEKISGFTIQERMGLTMEQSLTPESLKLATDLYLAELPSFEADPGYTPTRTLELEYYRKDGTTVWTESKFSIIRDEIGNAISILAEARDITERKLSEEKLARSYESTKKILGDAINTMVKIVELRDPYTAGHQQKVADLATSIAREMKLDDTCIEQLRTAALIHDIGKMYIPSDILSKPGKLSAIELGLIKTHSQSGYGIVKSMDFPGFVAEAVLQHHERLDGSGYPNQLKGEDTLLEAKILAVADVVEAMSSHRPYRPALGIDKALDELSKNSGRLYDPGVVDACIGLFKSGRFEFK
jgi:PAS domain S-box-containing protein/putative nucleotidyltransferase with HDIG domain